MAVQPIRLFGDPVLRQRAIEVDNFDKDLRQLVTDLTDTMLAAPGAGLAAPQIGVSLQVVIFEVNANPRYPDAAEVPFTVLVNPVVTPLSDAAEEGWEGCLSVPGMRGLVPRHTEIRYQGFDADGRALERRVSGFHARVVQHEVDHLNGILYPMRVRDLRNFGFTETLFPGQLLQDD